MLGLLLAVLVTAASVHDNAAGRDVVDELARRLPAVATENRQQRGFVPQRKRWAVERTHGGLMLHRRLARDDETLPERSRTMILWAIMDNVSWLDFRRFLIVWVFGVAGRVRDRMW